MSNEIAKTQTQNIERVTDAELIMHLENLNLLKDLTVGEKNTFIQISKAFNLNPFKREIYVSKYNGTMSIITGYETYIKRAERSGVLDGWDVATTGSIEKNDLKAIITIYRKDRSRPFVWEVKYSEYVQKTREGAVNKFWQKAETMTKKVAMAQGFRLCFNDELGGMPYTSDEMPEIEDVPHEVIEAPKGSVKTKIKADTTEVVTAPTTPTKPTLAEKAFNDGLNRIKNGESQLVQMMKDTFALSPEQVQELDAALLPVVAE